MSEDILSELILELKAIKNISETEGFDKFHSTICNIGNLYDPKSINELTQFLEDKCSEEDLMIAIIRTIEIFDDEVYVKEILNTAPILYEKSPGWCLFIFVRIINSDACKLELIRQLRSSNIVVKKTIKQIMEKINEENSIFLSKTVPVILATA
jgi:Immunity protein 30